ncbi:MAG: hypothetical protein ACKVX7_11065 [Planctomycetota bacterium]
MSCGRARGHNSWGRKSWVSAERITDRGTPVARLLPPTPIPVDKPFARRKFLPGVAALIERPIDGPDSAEIISSMRGED